MPKLKSEREIQRAHDILHAIVTGKAGIDGPEDGMERCHAALDALCWVLGHDHNPTFRNNLAAVEKQIKLAGYVLKQVN